MADLRTLSLYAFLGFGKGRVIDDRIEMVRVRLVMALVIP